ncbi:CRE-SRXA-4 protein [Caenorhabditis remanei]|uniref:CRE-SRXA-4 protein n=1 Tax=Caenorhabditis remanei TaxID=31234 RepID=E3LJI5_CAERE|nr:CRE-SRXA-4 protein [Caenorhabditis remanei]
MTWILTTSQIIFNILTLLCIAFDIVLFACIIKHRFFSNSNNRTPFVYITVMSWGGIIGKIFDIFMVDSWPIAQMIDPVDGYETYRKIIGKQITLIATFSYLTSIFINWFMTCHRVLILLSPAKAPAWFTDKKLFMYCSTIMALVLINLLIPYYSPCYVNFNALSSLHETACAPSKHMVKPKLNSLNQIVLQLTKIQNLYLIWVPISAVIINSTMISYIKLSRRLFKKQSTLSAATIKRENSMIRQACFIASYLSIFEIGYLFMRFYPETFGNFSQEVQSITYHVRLLASCTLNFFVYFVETKSTRSLILKFVGWKKKNTNRVSTVSFTQARKNQ